MAEFRTVAKLSEIPQDGGIRATVDGHKVALFRVGERVYAVDDVCTHEEASLSEGTIYADDDELTVECPKHGAMFDITTGQVLSLPAPRSVSSYETRIDGDDVLVSVEPRTS